MSDVAFVVHGVAQPAGSKRAFVHPSTGRAIVTDANARAKPWKAQVSAAAGEAMGGRELLAGPLELVVRFDMPRPQSHYGSGRNASKVRDSAPDYPMVKPDATKLLRAVEDALTGVVWRDDAQVVRQLVEKRYGPAKVQVTVSRVVAQPRIAAL